MSLDAKGNFGKILNFSHGRKGNIVRKAKPKRAPFDPKTQTQLDNRSAWRDTMTAWKALTPTEKTLWNALARGRHMSGMNYYIKENLGGAVSLVGLLILGLSVLGDEEV